MGGVPNSDLVGEVKAVTALEGNKISQTENVETVGCIDNKSGGNFVMGLGEVNKMEIRVVGPAQEKGSQTDLIITEGEEPNLQTTDRMATCYTELVDGFIEMPVEPKLSWAKGW
ncbi:hypothetical protein V6N11_074401 [Hibiscus sabdariffa]|uniref:Uncharacterized protein n=1 Tax=Hibiscus sabdariffa TaxID=183260 RepID=A0ABR2R3U6_9ROSI